MHTIKISLSRFSAAHRIVKGYQGKCQDLHGHDYRIALTLGAKQLDAFGFVVDFTDIKKHCERWVKEHIDHVTLLCEEDVPLLNFVRQEKQRHYILPDNDNTTVECVSKHLYHVFSDILRQLNPEVSLIEVAVWESDTSGAMYGPKSVSLAGEPCGL